MATPVSSTTFAPIADTGTMQAALATTDAGTSVPLSSDRIDLTTALGDTHALAMLAASTPPSGGAPTSRSVADMSLADKIAATTSAGMARAAKETTGDLHAALSNPKTVATVAGGVAVVAGAQAIPGVDAAVDVSLGAVGGLMYASGAPEHQANMKAAVGKLNDYADEIGKAKTQADLDKASKDFGDFVQLGGKEAVDVLGTFGGGGAAALKGASRLTKLGGVDGAIAAGSKAVGELGTKAKSAADAVVQHGDELAGKLTGSRPALAGAGAGPGAGTYVEARTAPESIRPNGSGVNGASSAHGSPTSEGSTVTSAEGAARRVISGEEPSKLTGLRPNVTYEFKGGFRYHTDGDGRVHQVEATLTPESIAKPGERSLTLQRSAGGSSRLTTDEGGHLIATRFNGPAHEVNHVAQDIKLNRGAFKKLENQWTKDLQAGKTVNVKIDLSYPKQSRRPEKLYVSYSVDGGGTKPVTFVNKSEASLTDQAQ